MGLRATPSLIGGHVGTLRIIFVRTQTPSIKQTAPSVGIQLPPPAGSPKNHSPRRGPTILGGTFGARVRATSLPRKIPRQIMPLAAMRPARRANSGRAAAYFVSPARHSPGRRLLRLHAPNKGATVLRTLRISECENGRVIPSPKKFGAGYRSAPHKFCAGSGALSRLRKNGVRI